MAANSSITEASARKWVSKAATRDTLFCRNIQGFHLFKTKTGASWRYRYHDDHGRLKTVTIARYSQMSPATAAEKALRWRVDSVDVLRQKEQQRKERLEAERLSQTRTLGSYLSGVYAQHQQRKRGGKTALSIIAKHFSHWLGRDMSTLTRADVIQWQSQKETENLSHATLQRVYGAVKTLLNHAVQNEFLQANPLEKVYLARPAVSELETQRNTEKQSKRRLLTADEVEAIFSGLAAHDEQIRAQRRNSRAHGKPDLPDLDQVHYPHWFHPFALVALYTGLRTGDIRTLTWQELNMTFKRLVKTPQKTRHHPDPVQIKMPLPDALVDAILPWWQQQGEPDTGLVFLSPRTGREFDKNAHERPWHTVKALGGLPEELVFYSLRHNFISALVADGVPLLTVAQLAGHKSASMIEKHYGHLCPATAANAMDGLARRIKSNKNNNIKQMG